MATITKTIKPSGGDYTSLSNWEAGEQADLVAAGNIAVAECYAMEDTTAVLIDGWNTDATHYIRITVPSAERHDGKRNTSKYRLKIGAHFLNGSVDVAENYTRFEGLQIRNSSAYTLSALNVGADYCNVSDCIFYDCATNGFRFPWNTVYLENCLALTCAEAGFLGYAYGSATMYLSNCVALNCANGFYTPTSRTIYCRNCYAGACSTAGYGGAGTKTLTTSHASDTSGNTQTSCSTSAGTYFTNVTAGSEDIHIGALSALIDAGTDLSADTYWHHPGGAVDIDGKARGASWDVGAEEYVAAGPAGTILRQMMQYV